MPPKIENLQGWVNITGLVGQYHRIIHDPLGQWVLDTRQLPAGVYLYSLIRDEIQLAGGSFIVRK